MQLLAQLHKTVASLFAATFTKTAIESFWRVVNLSLPSTKNKLWNDNLPET